MPEKKEVDRLWWDEENQIIRYKQLVDTVINEEMAQGYVDQIVEIHKDHPTADRLLIDLVNIKRIPDSKTRSILSGLLKNHSSFRIAYSCNSTAMRVALNFIITSAGHREIKAFIDEAEAIKWLKEAR